MHLVLGIVFALLFLKMEFGKSVSYTATTAFLPPSGQQADLSPLSMILGSAGLPGAEGQSDFVPLLKSRTIAEIIVGDSTDWEGTRRLIADIVIENQPKLTIIDKVTRQINAWIKGQASEMPTSRGGKTIMAGRIVIKQQLLVEASIDPLMPGIVNVKYTHTNPKLVQVISNRYVEVIRNHYRKQKTEKARKTYEFYVTRIDSIQNELDKNLHKGAKIIDEEKFRIFAKDEIPVKQTEGEIEVLKQMYAQMITLKESALNNLLQETPVVQVVDKPDPPYDRDEPSILLMTIFGLFLGVANRSYFRNTIRAAGNIVVINRLGLVVIFILIVCDRLSTNNSFFAGHVCQCLAR